MQLAAVHPSGVSKEALARKEGAGHHRRKAMAMVPAVYEATRKTVKGADALSLRRIRDKEALATTAEGDSETLGLGASKLPCPLHRVAVAKGNV